MVPIATSATAKSAAGRKPLVADPGHTGTVVWRDLRRHGVHRNMNYWDGDRRPREPWPTSYNAFTEAVMAAEG